MKRLILILVSSTLLIGIGWFMPHSLFSIKLEMPDQFSASSTERTPVPLAETMPLPQAIQPVIEAPAVRSDLQVGYQNLFFTIPVGLASTAINESVPASEGPMNPYPAFIRYRLNGYEFPSINENYLPEVRLYPLKEYVSINPWAAESLKRLRNVLDNPSTQLTNDTLPNVPFLGSAAQLYAAQAKIVSFKNGTGVRMISSYAQFPGPISQHDSFYHYEGLTQDGKYYVVVWMPVVLPVYSDTSNPGENGITYPPNYQNWEDVNPYYKAMTDLLNASSPDGFNPMLSQLDALVQSIDITNVPTLIGTTNESSPHSSPAEKSCQTTMAGTKTLTNTEDGYCLLYPETYSNTSSHYIVINPVTSSSGDALGQAWVSIERENAAGRTAAQVANEKIASVGQGFNISQFKVTIGNEQAIVIDGLPGQASTRVVFMIHNDRLYTLTFSPWMPGANGTEQLTPLEELYTLVVNSFQFLS